MNVNDAVWHSFQSPHLSRQDIFSFDNDAWLRASPCRSKDFFGVPEGEAWLLAPASKQLLERSYEARCIAFGCFFKAFQGFSSCLRPYSTLGCGGKT